MGEDADHHQIHPEGRGESQTPQSYAAEVKLRIQRWRQGEAGELWKEAVKSQKKGAGKKGRRKKGRRKKDRRKKDRRKKDRKEETDEEKQIKRKRRAEHQAGAGGSILTSCFGFGIQRI